MNASVILFFFFTVLAVVFSFPTVDDFKHNGLHLKVKEDAEDADFAAFDDEESQDVGARLPRATCDLLSFSTKFGSLNHSACAAHCLAMRKKFKGGRCKDGVCHCRR